MSLSLEKMWAIRNAHEEKYGQYCDNGDFEMVAQEIAEAAVKDQSEKLKIYSEHADLLSREALAYQARIRELEAAVKDAVGGDEPVAWPKAADATDVMRKNFERLYRKRACVDLRRAAVVELTDAEIVNAMLGSNSWPNADTTCFRTIHAVRAVLAAHEAKRNGGGV